MSPPRPTPSRAPLFPRHTIAWSVEEYSRIRRAASSLIGMAVLTGIVMHLYRWWLLAHRATSGGILFVMIAGGFVLLLGLTTVYLANHTVRQWLWRAPLFALVEGVTEAAVSAMLISAGVERIGTNLAQWNDWAPLSITILVRSIVVVLVFALILAGVVQWVRFALLKHEHRASTAMTMHEVREEEEEDARER